jgi:predicted ester cyclase
MKPSGIEEAKMSAESNKELVRRVLNDIWHNGDLDAADRLFTKNFKNHDPDAVDARDREGYKALATVLRTALPDLRITIDRMVAEGEYVAKYWTARATQTGPLPGVGTTGKAVAFTGTTLYRMDGEQVAECWWNKDTLGMLRQLGVIPA